MKKVIIALLSILVMLFMSSYAESIEELIPDEDLWGISQKEYLEFNDENNYSECKIGKKKGLSLSNVTVGSFVMDAYYVFDARMRTSRTSAGRAYSGLSKVTYILTGNNTKEELQSCFEALVADMTQAIGEPDTVKKAVSTWEYDGVKIEIGKGKFEKYTGSQDTSVAAVFTAIDIPYIRDIQTPTPKPSPTPTATSTPKPTPEVTPVEISEGLDEFGQSFSLHSGVKFGMTPDEVVETEKEAGFTNVKIEQIVGMYKRNCEYKHSDEVVSIIDEQVLGYSRSNIYYHFNHDRQLEATIYELSASEAESYLLIRDALIDKYGEPKSVPSELIHSRFGLCVYSVPDYFHINLGASIDYKYDDTWLFQQKDGSYIIVTGYDYIINTYADYFKGFTGLGFQLFSKEEVEEKLSDYLDNITPSPKPTTLTRTHATESTNSFELIPEVFVELYNTSFSTLLTTLGFDSFSADEIADFAEVSLKSVDDGMMIYSNSNNTVALGFTTEDKYSSAKTVMMYTSLKKEENPLLNLPQFAFAALISLQTQSSDNSSFLEWVNDECADGKSFVGESFFALCREDDDKLTIIVTLV